MANRPSPHASDGLSKRLKALRKAEGYDTAKEFATVLGISTARYGNFETGKNLSIEAAKLIVQKVPGVTLDWLYLDREAGLTVSLRQRLHSRAR
jgi:transcriptional regulator with XRE-family HTH domain